MRVRLALVRLDERVVPADLRIVTYNITAADGIVREGLVGNLSDGSTLNDRGILDTIGVQAVNGVTRPADILLLQETDTTMTAVQTVASRLNSYYGAGTYAAGSFAGSSTGGGTQGIVYRVNTVDLLEQSGVGTTSSVGAARQPIRYKFRLDSTTTEFYVYNSHMKAENTANDAQRRFVEADMIRANADLLPASLPILYAGDFNMYASAVASEPGYAEFLSAGNGQAQDVANPANNWTRNTTAFASLYTQAPLNNPPDGLVGGGLDDRFDFILMSTELTDGTGLEYRTNSYRVFGNNGSIGINTDITSAGNTALNNTGLNATERQRVFGFLGSVSDHLPVVADFIFPPTAVTSYSIPIAPQRSRVNSIAVTFNGPVPIALTPANFTITGFAGSVGVAHSAGNTTATLNFSGAGVVAGSLPDGLYVLNVLVNGVTNTTYPFHRLFGDANGDRTVDSADFSAFGNAFGSNIPNSPFDYDGNGLIDGLDFAQFGNRFGITL